MVVLDNASVLLLFDSIGNGLLLSLLDVFFNALVHFSDLILHVRGFVSAHKFSEVNVCQVLHGGTVLSLLNVLMVVEEVVFWCLVQKEGIPC
jgi:hypothetical protein